MLAQLPEEVVLAVVGNPAHIPEFTAPSRRSLSRSACFSWCHAGREPGLSGADVLLHPTLEDTFAMVVLEAMAYGLPVCG